MTLQQGALRREPRRPHAGGGDSPPPRLTHRHGRGHGSAGNRVFMAAMLFPAFALVVVFILVPLLSGIQFSLYDWNGVDPVMQWAGLANYAELWTDVAFLQALGRTVVWWIMHVVLAAGGGLLMAGLINEVRWRPAQALFRSLTFLPHVLSLAVVGVIWSQLYHPTVGLLNDALRAISLDFLTSPWLGDPILALPAVGLASAWQAYGFYMLIFLAGMQTIDPALHEAATIDGANARQRFRYVTLPALHNTISLVLVLAFVSALKGFGTVWAMTQGGPSRATELAAVYVWRQAFQSGEIGLASAAGLTIAVLAMGVAFAINRRRDRASEGA
jgi:raffinose/stachyose/melibiose transport system permease protein